MPLDVAILAAGIGTRLGRSDPKPLTRLDNGQPILRRQIALIRRAFGADARIHAVVGFKLDLIVEAAPDILFAYNELFDQTNTSKSLLKIVRLTGAGGLLWMNGDVVFDSAVLEGLRSVVAEDRSFVCVNTASVADEEVKYTLDDAGHIVELSKQVTGALGEAVGINYVSAHDKPALRERLDECAAQDYFERGIELTVSKDHSRWGVVDVSQHNCVEVDFVTDLEQANSLMGRAAPVGEPDEL